MTHFLYEDGSCKQVNWHEELSVMKEQGLKISFFNQNSFPRLEPGSEVIFRTEFLSFSGYQALSQEVIRQGAFPIVSARQFKPLGLNDLGLPKENLRSERLERFFILKGIPYRAVSGTVPGIVWDVCSLIRHPFFALDICWLNNDQAEILSWQDAQCALLANWSASAFARICFIHTRLEFGKVKHALSV